TVAGWVGRLYPFFPLFPDPLPDFHPFSPLEGRIFFVKDWARDGLVLIGDAAHTMSPAGAIGVNVALATAAVAAQVLYPLLGRGPVAGAGLHALQKMREDDVRTPHRLRLRAQRVLLGGMGTAGIASWLLPKILPLVLNSPLRSRIQRRMFLGEALPPLDPAFRFPEES